LKEDLTKDEVLQLFFDVRDNWDYDKIREAKEELEAFIEAYGEFEPNIYQVKEALNALTIWQIERYPGYILSNSSKFEKCYKLADVTYKRLSKKEEWELFDFRLLLRIIGYRKTFQECHLYLNDALEKLESYSDREEYIGIKIGFHMNILPRLLRGKYFDLSWINREAIEEQEPGKSKEIEKEIEDIFLIHCNKVIELCEQGNFKIFKAFATVRKGILLEDNKLMGEGFSVLEKAGEHELCKVCQDEIDEYGLFYTGLTTSTRQFNAVVGSNIKKIRKASNMTMDEVAKVLGIKSEEVKEMELGGKTISFFDLVKLSETFKVSFTAFLDKINIQNHHDPDYEFNFEGFSERIHKVQQFTQFAEKLSPKELSFATEMMNNLMGFIDIYEP